MEGLKPGVIANLAVSNVAFRTSDFAYVIYEVCGDTPKLVPASSAPLPGVTTGRLAGCNGPAGRIRPRFFVANPVEAITAVRLYY